jgi:hypothetical protein
MAFLAYPVASARHEYRWIVLLAAAALSATAAAAWGFRPHFAVLQDWFGGPGRWWSGTAARRFFAISGAVLLSGAVSSWALVAVRAGILKAQGLATAGEFDAAWAISMNQAGLVLASLQTYYLPALAGAADPAERAAHLTRVLTIAVLAAAFMIVAAAAAKPFLLQTLYSDAFTGAARYLRWTLIGDYFKVTSWILSIPLLAAADMRSFLIADLGACLSFAGGAAWLGRYFTPAEAAAAAFALMYAVHLLLCGTFLWRRGDFRPGVRGLAVWTAGLTLVLSVSAAFWDPV